MRPARESRPTFYTWKAKFGGMEVSDARKLQTLEDENRRLEKLQAGAVLEGADLEDALEKRLTSPAPSAP